MDAEREHLQFLSMFFYAVGALAAMMTLIPALGLFLAAEMQQPGEPLPFALAERLFAGGYEYKLYRGSVDASSPDSWYLRTEKVVTPPGNVAPVPGLGGIMQLALAAFIAAFAWRKRRVSVTKGLGLFASK